MKGQEGCPCEGKAEFPAEGDGDGIKLAGIVELVVGFQGVVKLEDGGDCVSVESVKREVVDVV